MKLRHIPESIQIHSILKRAKKLAKEYYELTEKPLGIAGEVAEYEVTTKFKNVKLAPPRQAGYDATERRGKKDFLMQIKGRRICKGGNPGMVPAINMRKKFDAVLLVLLDDSFEATEIYEASHAKIKKALEKKPISKARKKGALSVPQFRSIGTKRWPEDELKR